MPVSKRPHQPTKKGRWGRKERSISLHASKPPALRKLDATRDWEKSRNLRVGVNLPQFRKSPSYTLYNLDIHLLEEEASHHS